MGRLAIYLMGLGLSFRCFRECFQSNSGVSCVTFFGGLFPELLFMREALQITR